MEHDPSLINTSGDWPIKSEIINYWKLLWEEICNNFTRNLYNLEFSSPHLLVLDIIDEIEFNRLENPYNLKFFKEQCGRYLKSDPVVREFFKSDFILLSEQLKEPKFSEYFRILSKEILKKIENGLFFVKNCEKLKIILLDEILSSDNKNNLALLSQNLIIEFLLNNYELESIKEIPKQILSHYEIYKKNSEEYNNNSGELEVFGISSDNFILITNFPTKTKIESFKQGDTYDEQKYFEAVKIEIDSLTIGDRIDSLKRIFNKEEETAFFIFEVTGLQGPVDITIGDVNFYSPLRKLYVTEKNLWASTFGDNIVEFFNKKAEDHFINAAVEIQYRDVEFGKKLAIEKINKSLIILRSYDRSEAPFKIAQNKYLIVKNGKLVQSSVRLSKEEEFKRKYKSLELVSFLRGRISNTPFINDLNHIFFEEKSNNKSSVESLLFSLHWYKKGFESDIAEDKLLNYWIALENLFNFKENSLLIRKSGGNSKISIVREYAPPIILLKELSYKPMNLFSYFWHQAKYQKLWGNHGEIALPFKLSEETMKQCQLDKNEGDMLDQKGFIDNLNLIKKEVTDAFVTEKIIKIETFYSNGNMALNEIGERIKQIEDELKKIYRYRNFIVHKAHYDNKILPFFTEKAEYYTLTLINSIINEMVRDHNSTHFEIIFSKKVDLDQILTKLKSNEPVNFFNLN